MSSVPAVSPSEPDPSADQALFVRLQTGDADAFAELIRRYAPELLEYAVRRTGSRETAEDVVQDVFVRIWERRATLDVPRVVQDYLYGAVKHHLLNVQSSAQTTAAREARYALETQLGWEAPGALDTLGDQELEQAIVQAIDDLPARRREIVQLRMQQLTSQEIAQRLGISVKTVGAQITSAYTALRDRLAGWRPGRG